MHSLVELALNCFKLCNLHSFLNVLVVERVCFVMKIEKMQLFDNRYELKRANIRSWSNRTFGIWDVHLRNAGCPYCHAIYDFSFDLRCFTNLLSVS